MAFVCLYYGWRLCYQLTHIVSVATKQKLDPLFCLLVLQQSETVFALHLLWLCRYVQWWNASIYIYISTYICAINTFTLVLYLNTVEIIFTSFSTNWQQHRLLISVSKDLIHNHGNVFYNLWRCFITSLTASLTYWADYVLHQRTATLNQFILSAITLKKMIRNDHTDKWLT